jgi:hypothetical protein
LRLISKLKKTLRKATPFSAGFPGIPAREKEILNYFLRINQLCRN